MPVTTGSEEPTTGRAGAPWQEQERRQRQRRRGRAGQEQEQEPRQYWPAVVCLSLGIFAIVTPFLEQVTHVERGLIGAYLLTFGVAGIVGNFVAGATMVRRLRATFVTCAVLIAVATLLFPLLGRWDAGAIGLLVVWGLAYGAVPACSQTWFARSAPQSQEAAMVVFTSSFQLTLATGALLGGAVADATSSQTVMLCAGAIALTMVATVGGLGRPAPRS
ncbi:MFS transporter [Embleya sp. NPDC005575]|uniref:MFS transporter n=1 Tax=Embleya sp. NPDC005575 TaxID=3156892 RepID=UPI0033BD8F07